MQISSNTLTVEIASEEKYHCQLKKEGKISFFFCIMRMYLSVHFVLWIISIRFLNKVVFQLYTYWLRVKLIQLEPKKQIFCFFFLLTFMVKKVYSLYLQTGKIEKFFQVWTNSSKRFEDSLIYECKIYFLLLQLVFERLIEDRIDRLRKAE